MKKHRVSETEVQDFQVTLFRDWLNLTPGLRAMAEQAYADRDWAQYFIIYPRVHRFGLLFELVNEGHLTGADYWKWLREIWTEAERPGLYRATWLCLFTMDRSNPEGYRTGREMLMNEKERTALSALPDPIRIYRGAGATFARGMSWTMDITVASWFSSRCVKGGRVFVADVRKSKVLAYFEEGSEAEVIIDPRWMRLREVEMTPEQRDENVKEQQRRIREADARTLAKVAAKSGKVREATARAKEA